MSIEPIKSPINTYPQIESPITQLSLDITKLLLSYLKGDEVARLDQVCRNFRVITNNGHLWKLLFNQDFPYHTLVEDRSFREQYSLRFLIERNWDQDRCSLTTLPMKGSGVLSIFQSLIVGGEQNDTFKVYDKNTLVNLHSTKGHWGIDLEGFQDDGNYLISTANGGPTSGAEVKIWAKDSGNCISTIPDCLKFFVDDNQIFGTKMNMATYQLAVVVWNKLTGGIIHVLEPIQGTHSIAIDTSCFFAGMGDGKIKAWLKKDGSFIGSFECGKNDKVSALIEVDDLLISGHNSGTIRFWTKKERKVIHELIDPDEVLPVTQLRMENGFLISRSSDFTGNSTIKIWSEKERILLYTIKHGSVCIFDHDILYVGCKTGCIEARDKETGAILFKLLSPTAKMVFNIVISGSRLVATTKDGSELWDLKTKQLKQVFMRSEIYKIHLEDDQIFSIANEGITIRDFAAMRI